MEQWVPDIGLALGFYISARRTYYFSWDLSLFLSLFLSKAFRRYFFATLRLNRSSCIFRDVEIVLSKACPVRHHPVVSVHKVYFDPVHHPDRVLEIWSWWIRSITPPPPCCPGSLLLADEVVYYYFPRRSRFCVCPPPTGFVVLKRGVFYPPERCG